MLRRVLGASILLIIVSLLVYAVLPKPAAQASPQEVTVVTKTRGYEDLKATVLDGELRIRLKNNHHEILTAFAISFGDLMITMDFAYSDVNFGIEPGEIFENSYPVSPSPVGSELPKLYLLTVLLKNGAQDGSSKVAHGIKEERLGEKIQVLRTLRILEKEGSHRRDLQAIKSDLVAALNTGEAETLISLSEVRPNNPSGNKLSDDLRNGLQVGREKMLQRLEELEQLPTAEREEGFIRFQERANSCSPNCDSTDQSFPKDLT